MWRESLILRPPLPILSPLRPVLRCNIGGTNSYDCPLPALADKCQGTEDQNSYDPTDGPLLECVATPPSSPPSSPPSVNKACKKLKKSAEKQKKKWKNKQETWEKKCSA